MGLIRITQRTLQRFPDFRSSLERHKKTPLTITSRGVSGL